MGDANPIRTLGDYSKPSHKGYRNTIELLEGNNMDPSPHGRILLLVSLLNSFHREGLQNSAMTSLCSNNIKENLFLKHGIVSRLNLNSSSWHRSLAPMVPMTLSTAWKIPNKPLLIMHPRVPTTLSTAWRDDRNVMFIEIIRKNDDSREEGPEDEGVQRLKVIFDEKKLEISYEVPLNDSWRTI
nr:hypothetical protein [Tanacetum cinerariifolium]